MLVRLTEHTEAKLRRRVDRRERARNAHLLPRREHVETIAGLRPRRATPCSRVEIYEKRSSIKPSGSERKSSLSAGPSGRRKQETRTRKTEKGDDEEEDEEEAAGKNEPGQAPWGSKRGPRPGRDDAPMGVVKAR